MIAFSVLIFLVIIHNNFASENGFRLKRQTNICQRSEICEDTPYGYIPCQTSSAPRPLQTDNAKAILRQECPHLFTNVTQDPSVCCSDDQLISIQKVIALSSVVLNRCPACRDNMKRVVCHLGCAPNQQQFSETIGTAVNENNKTAVTEVNYYFADKFGKDYFDACKGVRRFNVTFERLLCPRGDCDFRRMWQFLGTSNLNGGHAPFQMNFIFSDSALVQANGKTFVPASLPINDCKDSCGCEHCAAAC